MTPPLQPDTSNDELPLLPGLRHADTAHGIAARLAELPPAAFQQAIDGSAAPPDLWLDLVLIFDERRQQDAVVRLLRRLATAIAGERECKLACLRLIANFRFTLANVLMAALIERHGPLPVLAEWREVARRYCYRQSLAGLPDHGALTPAFDRLSSCAAAIGDGGAPFATLPVLPAGDLGRPLADAGGAPVTLRPSRPLHLTPAGDLEACPAAGEPLEAGAFTLLENAVVTGGAHPVLVDGRALADDVLHWMEPAEFNPLGADAAYAGIVYRYGDDDAGRRAITRRRPPQRTLARGIFLNGPHQGNYYHWVTETLTRAAFLDDLPAAMDDWPLLVCRDALAHPNLPAALAAVLGERPRPLLWLERGETLRVESLLMPPRVSRVKACVQWQRHEEPRDCLVADEAVQRLHRRLALPGQRRRRLFLERGGAARLANQAEVKAALAARGFESVHPGELDFEAARRLYAEAAVIVSPAGAALANLVLAPRGCVALNLTYELCRHCGVFSALGTPVDQPVVNVCEHGRQPDTLDPFTLRPELVGRVLDAFAL